jgi:hypothetical protein
MRSKVPTYSHTQYGPLCFLLYALGLLFIGLGLLVPDLPWMTWGFPPLGLALLILAASFHRLSVYDTGDTLVVQFGPLPLLRTQLKFADMKHAEPGQTLWSDGLGIHLSLRGGWVWNLWGRECVVVHRQKGVFRIGTNDAHNLTAFLSAKIQEHHRPEI